MPGQLLIGAAEPQTGQCCGTENVGEAAKEDQGGYVCHEKLSSKPVQDILTLTCLKAGAWRSTVIL